jgi:hypothetical protein
VNELQEARRRAEASDAAARAEVTRLRAEVEQLRTARPPAAAPPPAAPLTEDEAQAQRVRDRLYQIIPGLRNLDNLAKLAERSGDIDGALSAIQGYQQAENAFYESHADTQCKAIYEEAAKLLGPGKTAADLPEMTKQGIDVAFSRWVAADPQRTARYDRLENLVGEFWPVYRAAMYDPMRRSSSAEALTTHANRPPVPVGGGGGAVTTTAPTRPAAETEDDVHARGWAQAREAMSGTGG